MLSSAVVVVDVSSYSPFWRSSASPASNILELVNIGEAPGLALSLKLADYKKRREDDKPPFGFSASRIHEEERRSAAQWKSKCWNKVTKFCELQVGGCLWTCCGIKRGPNTFFDHLSCWEKKWGKIAKLIRIWVRAAVSNSFIISLLPGRIIAKIQLKMAGKWLHGLKRAESGLGSRRIAWQAVSFSL